MAPVKKVTTLVALSLLATTGAAASTPESYNNAALFARNDLIDSSTRLRRHHSLHRENKRLLGTVSGIVHDVGHVVGTLTGNNAANGGGSSGGGSNSGSYQKRDDPAKARGIIEDLLGGDQGDSGSSSSAASAPPSSTSSASQPSTSSSGGNGGNSSSNNNDNGESSGGNNSGSSNNNNSGSNVGNSGSTNTGSGSSNTGSNNNNNNENKSTSTQSQASQSSNAGTSNNAAAQNAAAGNNANAGINANAVQAGVSAAEATGTAASAAAASILSVAAASASLSGSSLATSLATQTLPNGSFSTGARTTPTGTASGANSAESESGGSNSTKIVVPIVIVAGCLALAAIGWTLIRRAKKGAARQHDPRMRPIDFEPTPLAAGRAFAIGGASTGRFGAARHCHSIESFEAGRPMNTLTEETGEYENMGPPMQEVGLPAFQPIGSAYGASVPSGRLHNYGRGTESHRDSEYHQQYSTDDDVNYYDGSSRVGYTSSAARGIDAAGAFAAGGRSYSPYADLQRGSDEDDAYAYDAYASRSRTPNPFSDNASRR